MDAYGVDVADDEAAVSAATIVHRVTLDPMDWSKLAALAVVPFFVARARAWAQAGGCATRPPPRPLDAMFDFVTAGGFQALAWDCAP
jgi:hypothetical protein